MADDMGHAKIEHGFINCLTRAIDPRDGLINQAAVAECLKRLRSLEGLERPKFVKAFMELYTESWKIDESARKVLQRWPSGQLELVRAAIVQAALHVQATNQRVRVSTKFEGADSIQAQVELKEGTPPELSIVIRAPEFQGKVGERYDPAGTLLRAAKKL